MMKTKTSRGQYLWEGVTPLFPSKGCKDIPKMPDAVCRLPLLHPSTFRFLLPWINLQMREWGGAGLNCIKSIYYLCLHLLFNFLHHHFTFGAKILEQISIEHQLVPVKM